MRTPFFSVLVILALIPLVPSILSDPLNQPLGDFDIPNWVKNTASWWSDDKIPDSSFIEMIEFLIKDEMITVEIPDLDSEVSNEIPAWVKNTASWWSDDKIPDVTFVGAIKYLISQGIIHVEREQVEESEKCTFKGFEVVCPPMKHTKEIKEFHIAVNDGNCCLNWAYVGEEYRFQIKTFDEFRGSPTDDVTTTAKIISKDGELRHHFGMITTEDGIYRGSVIIPSIDWYAGNILSVTGQYNGIEKTIEKEFEVFKAESEKWNCVIISCYTLTSVSNVVDTASLELDGVREIALFTKGSSTYVIVVAEVDDGFEIIDISNPEDPTSVSRCDDDSGPGGGSCNATRLKGVSNVAVTTIGGTTYAVLLAYTDKAISIFDISNPSSPNQVANMAGTSGNGYKLQNAWGLAVAEFGGKTYAVVVAQASHSLALVDISDPTSLVYKDHILNGDGEYHLNNPVSVAIATISGTTYAVVTAAGETPDGIAIIDISTDPTDLEYVGEMDDDADKELDGPNGVTTTTIGGKTYAIVVGQDDGIAIIDISTPSSPVYVSEIEDDADKELEYGRDVEVATINGRTYAFVAAVDDDALAIIDISNPSSPVYAGEVEDDSNKGGCTAVQVCLDGAKGVVITEIGGNTYAVVTSHYDDGIEIIRIMS